MKRLNSLYAVLASFLVLLASCNPELKIVTPESVGLSSDTLELANLKMQEYIDSGKFAGISTLIMKDGKIAQKQFFGSADLKNQKPMDENTIVRIFSMTKPITAVALMTLYDEGKFQLDDKVSKFIPEFDGLKVYTPNENGQTFESQINEMTVRHLLTHTSGISYGWNQKSYVDSLYRVTKVGNWDQTLREQVMGLFELPLNFQPGSKWEYGLSIDVAGYLVEVLSGLPLDVYFKTRIFDPLKMNDTGFFVPEDKQERLSDIFSIDKEGVLKGSEGTWSEAFKKTPTLFSGGGGLVSTMDDYLRFCRMLLNGGKLDGERILQEATVKMVMSDQMPENATYKEDNGYGLGGNVNLKTGEYSWAGMASTNFWIDTENDMIIITLAQHLPSNYSYAYVFKDLVNRALKPVN